MITRYCTECEHYEKRTLKAEIPFLSGNYIENGTYHRCKITGRIFNTWNMTEEEQTFLTCNCQSEL